MDGGKSTVLIQKDPTKGNAVGNYRLIACYNLEAINWYYNR